MLLERCGGGFAELVDAVALDVESGQQTKRLGAESVLDYLVVAQVQGPVKVG